MKTLLVYVSLLLMIFSVKLSAQSIGIGGSLGGGYISGESPKIGSFTTSVFMDTYLFSKSVFPRLSFFYGVDFEEIIPGSRNAYYPIMKGVSLKAILSELYEDDYYLEGGAGFIYLNDRTFSSTNSWSPGVALSLTAGIDFANLNQKGFMLGLGTEYAFTFTNTFPTFFSLHLQSKYVF